MPHPTLSELPAPPHGKSGFPWTEANTLVSSMLDLPFPTISIVTPSYNQASFIEETIRSVLLQGYPNLEYMVMDGGSTDGSVEHIRRYEPWLTYWTSEPDGGQSVAINKGWHRARGEIVAWLNSDDTLMPGALVRVATFLLEHPEVDIVYGDCDYIDSESKSVWRYPTRPYNYSDLVCSTINFIPQPATFIRRRVLEQSGYLDQSLHYAMDLDYWLRLGVHHTIAYLPARLATSRLHQESKTIGSVKRFAPELIRIYQRLFEMPDLAQSVRARKSLAMGNAYYRAANYAYLAGDFAEARHYALMGWLYAPFNLQRVLFKILFLSWGPLGLWITEKLSRDPLTKAR